MTGLEHLDTVDPQPALDRPTLRIDGRQPLSRAAVAALDAACDTAEDRGGRDTLIVELSGAPQRPWPHDLTVSLVSKWERALRRLERLPAATVAIVDGDCGGLALETLLATDYRIATNSGRLVVTAGGEATWPGMAVYRLARHAGSAAAIRRAVLFGTPVEAADALALQLVDELADDLPRALAAAARRVGGVCGTELAIRRQLMAEASSTSFEEALGVHLAACDRALRRATAGAAS